MKYNYGNHLEFKMYLSSGQLQPLAGCDGFAQLMLYIGRYPPCFLKLLIERPFSRSQYPGQAAEGREVLLMHRPEPALPLP